MLLPDRVSQPLHHFCRRVTETVLRPYRDCGSGRTDGGQQFR